MPSPALSERPFGIDELFISTTDRKGHIRMTNHVFIRVSGYARDELIGRAHNVIRHPDMPRAVFAIFWQRLQAGLPAAAYVNNRAKDGAHYWVMAIAIPVPDGYLSVRLKPSGPHFALARRLYEQVLAVEREVEGSDVRKRKPSIEAGLERLHAGLAEAGFEDYEAFMCAAFTAEVAARDAALAGRAQPEARVSGRLADVHDAVSATRGFLDALGERLRRHGGLSEELARKSEFVAELADSIRLFSLNAIVSAARLGDGAALGAVAGLLRTRSDAAAPAIDALGGELADAVERLGRLAFDAAVGRIQAEMMLTFVDELVEDRTPADEAASQLRLLAGAVAEGTEAVALALRDVEAGLDRLARHSDAVARHLEVIRVLEVNGRIEASRASDTEHVRTLFEEIGRQVSAANAEMDVFRALGTREERDVDALRASRAHAARVRDAVAALA